MAVVERDHGMSIGAPAVVDNSPAVAAARTTPAAALAALGIVFGDLGTSPLYTLQAVVGAAEAI